MELEQVWGRIIEDLNSDDIVLLIKLPDPTIALWNSVFDFLLENYSDCIYNLSELSNISVERELADTEQSISINMKLSNKLEIFLTFYELDDLHFYTNSVIGLSYEEAFPLFAFIRNLGQITNTDVHIHTEFNETPSATYHRMDKSFHI